MQYLNVILIFSVLTTVGVASAPTSPEFELFASRAYCGFQHSDDYTRDNNNISLDEFPWIAQLLYDEEQIVRGVGSLINHRYVLTTAHSLLRVDKRKLTGVRLGDTDVTTARDCVNHTRFGEECSDPVEEYDIEELIPHPKFSKKPIANDIGLIRLSRYVIYTDYIRPICMPAITNLELKDVPQLVVSGWGLDFDREAYGHYGNRTKIKKKMVVQLVPIDTCRKVYVNWNVTDNQLCVMEQERYSCYGDGGGPLMMSAGRNQWEQIGILSAGIGCGPDNPTVYVKVSRYVDWIRESVHE